MYGENGAWWAQRYQKASRNAQESIRKSTEHLESVALNSPADAKAQSRAKAAVDFCKDFESVLGSEESQQGIGGLHYVEEDNGNNHPNDPIPASSDSQTVSKAVPLPHELYLRIISFVDGFDSRWRSKTLALLCSTSHLFRHFAEQFLYTRPPDLDTMGQQWQFLFTLTIQPRLRDLVRSLHLRWWMRNENGGLLVNIARFTPSLQALTIFHEGPGRGFYARDVLSHHAIDLASLLGLCPKVTEFKYHTDQEDIEFPDNDDDDEPEITYGIFEEPWTTPSGENFGGQLVKDPRFAAFARQLTHLDLDGETNLLEKALTLHLSTNLRSLTIKHPCHSFDRPPFPRHLPQQCPHLEKLWVFSHCLEAPPVLTACLEWANTLRDLFIGDRNYETGDTGEYLGQWITQNMSKMVALQHLELDMDCWTETFGLISKHHPPRLASLRIKNLSNKTDEQQSISARVSNEVMTEKIELDLCHLIASLGETLESMHIGRIGSDSPMSASKSVLNSCKQAPNLSEFWAVPGRDAISSDVDDLLDTCPRLHIFPPRFLRWTWREDEWTQRKKRYCLQDREERLSQFRLNVRWLW